MSPAKPGPLDLSRLGPSAWLAIAAGTGAAAGLLVGNASSPVTLLALAVGGAAAAAILASPEVGLMALAFTTYVGLSNVLIQFHGAPSIGKILTPLVLLAILLRWARTGERPQGWQQPALLVSVYGLACTLSMLTASDPGTSLERLALLAKNAVVFTLVAHLVGGAKTLRRVVWVLIATGGFLGTIAVHQQLTGNFEFSYWGFGRAPEAFAVEGDTTTRLGGPIGDPNFFGMMLLALVPMALDRALAERHRGLRIAAMWAALVTTLTIFFTYSRSALVSLVAVLLLFVAVRRPRPVQLATAALVVLLLAPLVPTSYGDRVAELASSVVELTERGTTREVSVRGRLSENLVAGQMFLEHPVIGVGLANYPVRYQEYSRKIGLDPRHTDRQPHNLYLEVLAETGLVGFAAFGLLLWVALRGAVAARRTLRDAGRTDLVFLIEGFTLGFGAYLIASIFLHATHSRYFWLLAGIAVALPRVAAAELGPRDAEHRS